MNDDTNGPNAQVMIAARGRVSMNWKHISNDILRVKRKIHWSGTCMCFPSDSFTHWETIVDLVTILDLSMPATQEHL